MFLPKDYEVPVTDNYMKFQTGDNTFRVLSSAIVGWEFWKTEKIDGKEVRKPIRRRPNEGIVPDELGVDKWGNEEIPKHFWAFVVYNCDAKKIQILEITQKGVQRAIRSLTDNKKWGDPKEYNIVVTRTGEGLETEYSVTPEPKEEIDKEIIKQYEAMNINLEALYDGDDPFKAVGKSDDVSNDPRYKEIFDEPNNK